MAGEIIIDQLAPKILRHPGTPGVSTLYVPWGGGGADVAVNDTIVFGTETWTFINGVPGNFQINIGAATTDAVTAMAGAALAINGDVVGTNASSLFRARDASVAATVGILECEEVACTGTNHATTTTIAGGAAFSAANVQGERLATFTTRVMGRYTVGASDVLAWAASATARVTVGGFPNATVPRAFMITVQDTNGVYKSVATIVALLTQVDAGAYYLLEVGDPGAVLAATDVITYDIEL